MPWKMENQHLVSLSWQCSSTLVSCGQGLRSKEQSDTGASPILSWPGSSQILPFPLFEISIEITMLLWCYWHEECDTRAEKSFMKWLPGMFPAPLQLLAEVYNCTSGLFWRKCGLEDCTVLYFWWSDSRNILKLPHLEISKQSSLLSKICKRLFSVINQFSSHQNLQVWCV